MRSGSRSGRSSGGSSGLGSRRGPTSRKGSCGNCARRCGVAGVSEQDSFAKWAGEVQRMRMEHEAEMKRQTAKAFQKGRQSAQGYPYEGWTWRGGKFCAPEGENPIEAL